MRGQSQEQTQSKGETQARSSNSAQANPSQAGSQTPSQAESQPAAPRDSLAEAARSAFLQRYRERRPRATLQRMPVYEAVFLGQRAMTMMWIQARGWDKAAESLLVMAMERLKSRSL